MKVLALDTCSLSGSIALSEGGPDGRRLVAELVVADVGRHSEWLLKSVKGLLEDVGWSPGELDRLALGLGPGSFTGLRIGVSVVKGLAWAMDIPVVGVSTLKALSMNLGYSELTVCPLLDARKGEVYTALYRALGETMEPVMDDCALSPGELVKRVLTIEKRGDSTVFIGDGLRVYAEMIRNNLKGAKLAPESLWHVRASNIAELSLRGEGKTMDPREVSPVYLRKSEAEIKKFSFFSFMGRSTGRSSGR
jgi:tRNA threonylcarbamoyladenosine biosynthesis protein TsaB